MNDLCEVIGLPSRQEAHETEVSMYQINRSVVVVRRKQPFVDWANSTNAVGDTNVITLADVNDEPNVYLIPEYEDDKSLKRILPTAIACIWDSELSGWYTDEARWPRDRSANAFHEWFDLEIGSMVYDLLDDPIAKEET